MKRLVITLIILLCSTAAKAQSAPADTLAAKVDAMTTQLSTLQSSVLSLQSTIATLEAKVNEVTAQNLALKHAISLQPTIVEAKTEDGLDFRLIEAKGETTTGNVTLVISVANTTEKDMNLQCSNVIAVDINGQQYKEPDQFEKAHIGETHINSIATLISDAPLEMLLSFRPKSDIPYIKVLDVEAYNNHSFRFTNIPINWE